MELTFKGNVINNNLPASIEIQPISSSTNKKNLLSVAKDLHKNQCISGQDYHAFLIDMLTAK